jgi:predicted dehydrogenase
MPGVIVDTKRKLLMVGCTSISRTWLNAVRNIPDIEMVGFVDIDIQAAREKAPAYYWSDADF